MADYGLAVTWGELKPGREKKTLELWGDAVAFSDKLVANGGMERWDAVVFEPSGAYPQGVVRYFGTTEQVDALTLTQEVQTIVARGQHYLVGFGFRRFVSGDALFAEIGRFAEIIDTL